MKTIFGQTGDFDWQDSCRLCLAASTASVVLRHEALELLRSDAVGRGDLHRAAEALRRLADPAGRRGDPAPPRLLQRAEHGEAAGRLQRRPAADARRGIDTSIWCLDRPVGGSAALLSTERRRLGLHALARHGDLPRALVHRRQLVQGAGMPNDSPESTRPKLVQRSIQFWGNPTVSPQTQTLLAAFAQAQLKRRATPPPGASRPPCASLDRRLPPTSRPPEMSDAATARAPSSSAARSPRPGGACRRSSRACRCLPGTGLDRRAFLSRTRRARARRLRRRRARAASPSTTGSRRAAVSPPRPGSSSRSSSPAASTACRCSSRPAIRPTTAAAEARAQQAAGIAVHGGRPALLASVPQPHRQAPRRGQGHGDPGDRLRRPRPVALHLAPLLGGRRDRRRAAHRLDGPLPRRGRDARQPAAGAVARRHACSRRSRPRRCPWRRCRRPTSTPSRRRG